MKIIVAMLLARVVRFKNHRSGLDPRAVLSRDSVDQWAWAVAVSDSERDPKPKIVHTFFTTMQKGEKSAGGIKYQKILEPRARVEPAI